jgi:hypothetical protein
MPLTAARRLQGNEEKAVAAAARLPPDLPLELRVAGMMHPSSKPGSYQQVRSSADAAPAKGGGVSCWPTAHAATLPLRSLQADAAWAASWHAAPSP